MIDWVVKLMSKEIRQSAKYTRNKSFISCTTRQDILALVGLFYMSAVLIYGQDSKDFQFSE